MPLKRNTARELPVILIDSSDFITGLAGKVFGDVTCKYRKDGSSTWITKTINAGNWGINTNAPAGNYTINFTNTELNTNGLFEYNVFTADSLVFPGLFEFRDNTNDDLNTNIDSNETKIDITIAGIIAVDGNVDLILEDTNEIQGKLPSGDIAGETEATANKDEIVADIGSVDTKIDDIDTSAESEARFDEIKGVGWVDENLKTIQDLIGNILSVGDTIEAGVVVIENVDTIQEILDLIIIRKTDKVYEVTAVDKVTGVAIDLTGVTDIQYAIKQNIDDPDYIVHKDLGPVTKASKTILTSNKALDYEFKTIGVEGNDVSVEYDDPGANDSALSVTVVETIITRNSQLVTNKNILVSLATDGAGVITSTANNIKAIIEANTDADALVDITVPGTGADVVTAVSQTYLVGGLSGGIVYTDQANGVFKITIPQSETFAADAGKYVYDIIATILNTRTQLVGGCVQFITGVTE